MMNQTKGVRHWVRYAILVCLLVWAVCLVACASLESPVDTTVAEQTITEAEGSAGGDTQQTETYTDVSQDTAEPPACDESSKVDVSYADSETDADTDTATATETECGTETETETETETQFTPEQTPKREMPHIDIYTENGRPIVSKENYINATISVGGCDEAYVLNDCPAGVRIRGNSTAVAPKKPYRIKFETKQGMLGLNDGERFKSWCLMADYYDHSMLRTWATFNFADILLEDKYFSSDCIQVELYINDEYQGVYLLCEQTQIDNDRVDIYEMKEGETSVEIGYLMIGQGGRTDEPESIVVYPQIDIWDRNGNSMYFGGLNFALSGSGYTQAQKDYVSTYVSAVFKVMSEALYNNRYYSLSHDGTMTLRPQSELQGMTTAQKQYDTINAVFNIEAAVRMCVLDEIVMNLDAMTFNMYVDLSPRGDGRLTLAAPWDFDFAMANTYYPVLHSSAGFYATNLSVSDGMRTNLFYVMLGRIDWFEDMCRQVWQTHYHELQEVAREVLVRTYCYEGAYNRDWDLWGRAMERTLIFHHCQNDLAGFAYHRQAGQFVHEWLTQRLIWLNRKWGDSKTIEPAPVRPELQVDFSSMKGRAYLTDLRRCTYALSPDGLRFSLTEARDPHFYINFTHLSTTFLAEDYYVLEVEYMIPVTNSLDRYAAEFFLCTGNVWDATGGVSVMTDMGEPDGQWHTLRIDLSDSAYWGGDIHKIRFDYFHECAAGDQIYIRSAKLLPQ